MKRIRIAIDGSAASGKTTVARMLAERLKILFLDTGLMYRAVTWLALEQGLSLEDGAGLTRLAESRPFELVRGDSGSMRIEVEGRDITDQLHHQRVSSKVSVVAAVSGVRRALVEAQQQVAAEQNLVMVGRDIATVVLPEAELKVFLTAQLQERARRRYMELKQMGQNPDPSAVEIELERRDKLDSEREDSPLTCVEDAVAIDSTGLTPDEIVDQIVGLV